MLEITLQGVPMRVSAFGLWDRFDDEWVLSRQASGLFLVAIVLVLAMTGILMVPPLVREASLGMRLLSTLVGVTGPVAVFFLWLGMWRYWARLDNSTVGTKRLWFVVLLLTFWCGSCLYYFAVYRPRARVNGS